MDEPSNHLLVHLSPDRHAFYRNSPPIFWSDQLNCWITAHPQTMQLVQKSASFRVLDQSAELERIRSRLNMDFPNIDCAFRNVPVGSRAAP